MYTEIKLKRTQKLKKNVNKRKHIKNRKLTKQILKAGFQKKHTQTEVVPKQHLKISKSSRENTISFAKGGGKEISKEKFEVKRLADIDYNQFSLSKYLDSDIDWGTSPGSPPTDCCIL